MSGSAPGAGAAFLRAALAAAEPFYASAIFLRNRLYDSGILSVRRLARPVISIGNLTTGGTGKTPMVQWLAERLRAEGRQVAVLSRGYGGALGKGDEVAMLARRLNDGASPPVLLCANPDRFSGGTKLLRENAAIDVFVLDDGFQHRRLARDLDMVLVNAAEPFGFGRLLPRGLLREPLASLARAGAVVITHTDAVPPDEVDAIEARVRPYHPAVPIYRAAHTHAGLYSSGAPGGAAPDLGMEELARRRFFAFCGIASPESFDHQLSRFGESYVGRHWFADHHDYRPQDLELLNRQARAAGADILLTTEKDWIKIAALPQAIGLPIYRIALRMQFFEDGEPRLLEQIDGVLARGRGTMTQAECGAIKRLHGGG